MRRTHWLVLAAGLALLLGACGDETAGRGRSNSTAQPAVGGAEAAIDVSLTEFEVGLSWDTGAAGTVTFTVRNDGLIPHDFHVIQTVQAAASLPVDESTRTVDLSSLDVRASTDELDPGQSTELEVQLPADSYVLICNVPMHRDNGMFVAFTVR